MNRRKRSQIGQAASALIALVAAGQTRWDVVPLFALTFFLFTYLKETSHGQGV